MSLEMARVLSSGRRIRTPQKDFLARPAGPQEPRRGSRDGLKLAPRPPLGGHYGVEMAREVANLVSGLLWQHPSLGYFGLLLGLPGTQNCNMY